MKIKNNSKVDLFNFINLYKANPNDLVPISLIFVPNLFYIFFSRKYKAKNKLINFINLDKIKPNYLDLISPIF